MTANDETDEEKRLKNTVLATVIFAALFLLTFGYALGFMHGTAVQEQELIDQLMIRDLHLNACYDPASGDSISYKGKSKIYLVVNADNNSQMVDYLKYKGKLTGNYSNDPNATDYNIIRKN